MNEVDKFEKIIGLKRRELEFDFFETLENICKFYKNKGKRIIIYGAGSTGRLVFKYLKSKDIEINYFSDSDVEKHGNFLEGKKILPPKSLSPNDFVVIASSWEQEIAIYLKRRKIRYVSGFFEILSDLWIAPYSILREHLSELLHFFDMLFDEESKNSFIRIFRYLIKRDPLELKKSFYEQYFHPFIDFNKIECVIDGGAYPGDFTDKVLKDYSKISCYLFEPDPENYKFLASKYKDDLNIKLINKALFNSMAKISFSSGIGMGSHIDFLERNINNSPQVEVETVPLDGFLLKEGLNSNISLYIKMDIEGAELDALRGAENTIKKLKPKLAVCLYHRPEHLFLIPSYLESLNNSYRFFLGHHENKWHEVVLYAL